MTQQCIKEFNVIFYRSITGPDPDEFVTEDNTLQYGWIARATFKDLGYTIGPLAVGTLMEFTGIKNTFFLTGAAFAVLIPIALVLHD